MYYCSFCKTVLTVHQSNALNAYDSTIGFGSVKSFTPKPFHVCFTTFDKKKRAVSEYP